MNPVPRIGELIGLEALEAFSDPATWWTERERIEELLADHLSTRPTRHWLDILEPADVWCAPVLTLPELVGHEGFRALAMDQEVRRPSATGDGEVRLRTTRSPLRIDHAILRSDRGAPRLGEHTSAIDAELGLRAGRDDGAGA